MLNAEAARSNSSFRSQNTVCGYPELRGEKWSSTSLRASLGEVDPEDDNDNVCGFDIHGGGGEVRDASRSRSVDLSLSLLGTATTPVVGRNHVMMNEKRDFSSGVLSDSAKSNRRKSWASPFRLLERVRSRRSPGSGNGKGSPGRK